MDIQQEQQGDVTIVKLSGKFDSSAAPGAETQLGAALGGGAPHLAIDMTGLEYISSAGLRVLLVLARKIQQGAGKVALFGLAPNVREVFSVSGLDTILSIQPDSAAALAHVR